MVVVGWMIAGALLVSLILIGICIMLIGREQNEFAKIQDQLKRHNDREDARDRRKGKA